MMAGPVMGVRDVRYVCRHDLCHFNEEMRKQYGISLHACKSDRLVADPPSPITPPKHYKHYKRRHKIQGPHKVITIDVIYSRNAGNKSGGKMSLVDIRKMSLVDISGQT